MGAHLNPRHVTATLARLTRGEGLAQQLRDEAKSRKRAIEARKAKAGRRKRRPPRK